ncbi:GspE/PulE family protein [Merismopedia glauca]|uniref:Type II/IV secretion system protein n=1 Tax=Merismopedia glauca CCAP 1448/3 TaxID=1296344 RepID=A0A2T1C1L1_9CYAN|nr:GspE/PulE family protein [Merismopedia glauca]PSB02037.1 type II/IV secretion system protein [Merismopedia glauca CCAP 1448/3]
MQSGTFKDSNLTSAWSRLINQEIDCAEALEMLVDKQGNLIQNLLDREVTNRFFRHFPNKQTLPPVVPLLLWRGSYCLGSPVPLSPEEIVELNQRCGSQIKIVQISESSYKTWFRTEHPDPENHQITTDKALSQAADQIGQTSQDQRRRIGKLLKGALTNRVSDIHLEPLPDGLKVRYRIDGVLRDITTIDRDGGRKLVVALKVMCKMDIAESRRPQDGRIDEKEFTAKESDDREIKVVFGELRNILKEMDTRVSTLPCVNGEKAVIRLLTKQNRFNELDSLGLSPKNLKIYQQWLQQPQGMIVLTGPTGSGKTSTLYTSLQAVANEHVNVITVEDPVEYVLPGITQTQVHEAAGMTFAAGLRSILRQDPDIIMVGEVRDHETAETAVRAALTGHLVFTTLHTNDAIGAIPRLKDIGPDPGLVADALLGIVAQRLVRIVCPHCNEPHTPSDEELNILGLDRKQADSGNWRKGKGCPKCFNSGYMGREAIVELINVDRTVRDAIHEGTTIQLDRYLNDNNYVSFRTAAIEKVMSGITTVQEVLRVIPHSAFTVAPKPPVLETKVSTNGHNHHPELHLVKYQP